MRKISLPRSVCPPQQEVQQNLCISRSKQDFPLFRYAWPFLTEGSVQCRSLMGHCCLLKATLSVHNYRLREEDGDVKGP